ncbi:hypothetical protein E0H26_25785 [Micromonospora zingiberis]|uniref:Uncharacterized protein n=1 Tax=Micromonospora zingiberis TaxID=2053011 RepID=A0A4R0G5Q7_9ACTN|nr:hypothetical protein [Micromonospora zingiberis]TCB91262.1 hypothetical protein E0H26_25785 [Micromonospora zingiberis]
MSVSDPDPLWTTLRLVLVILSLGLLAFGVRVVVSRSFPAAWVRITRMKARQQSQPVRIGGGQALIGASLLAQQAPFLIPMPTPAGGALLMLALLLAVAAAGWYVWRSD